MRGRGLIAVLAGLGLGCALAPAPAAAAGRATYATWSFENVKVPMRDGVHLDVNIWRPDVPTGVKVPVILTLTPYGILDNGPQPWTHALPSDDQAKWFVPLGYARVFADVRGTRNSEGCYDYGGVHERQDGYDLVEWLAKQPWSSGKVGMVGTSYEGTTANAAAAEHPPHLAAIVPIASINKWYDYAYELGTRYFGNSEVPSDEGIDTPAGFTYGFGIIPPVDPNGNPTNIVTRISPCDRTAQDQHGYNLQPDYDAYFQDRDYLAREVTSGIPTWIVHGLQDNNVRTWEGTEVWEALPKSTPKKLWLGRWPHADGSRRPGTEWRRQMTAWWDKYLMGLDSAIDREPAVDVEFPDQTWHQEVTWPPPTTVTQALYLHPAAGAAGLMDTAAPKGDATESFIDDPTLSENRMLLNPNGPDPARLTYATAPLKAALREAGRPVLDIWARSSAAGTHYSVELIDIDATGKWSIVHRGFGNARYRNGLTTGADTVPGQDYEFKVPILDDDYTFAAGHRIGLVLSSSNLVWALPDEHLSTNTILYAAPHATALLMPTVLAASVVVAPSPSPSPVTGGGTQLPSTSTAPPVPELPLGLALGTLALLARSRRRPRGRGNEARPGTS